MRIALCHEWLTTYGGSDQVASEIARSLDIKDVFTFALDPSMGRDLFPHASVNVAHRIGRSSLARRHWGWLLPAMPYAWKRLDLSSYDMVITSSHSCVNAIRVPDGTPVISYCHTPMRYAWEWRQELQRFPRPVRPLWPAVASRLRRADRRWAQRVTTFVANSRNVAERIKTYYGRPAEVVYPPIDLDFWTPDPSIEREDFYLYAGRLVGYKRPDLVIEGAKRAGVRLVVAGSGPQANNLRALGGTTIEFVDDPSREHLRDLYRKTKALVFAGIEDFGMTLVEAQACGAPVIARAEGGALESVRNGSTGLLIGGAVRDVQEALATFDGSRYSSDDMRSNAERFSAEIFRERIRSIVQAVTDGRSSSAISG